MLFCCRATGAGAAAAGAAGCAGAAAAACAGAAAACAGAAAAAAAGAAASSAAQAMSNEIIATAPSTIIILVLIVFLPFIQWFRFLVLLARRTCNHHIMIDCSGTIRDKLDKVNAYWLYESLFRYLFKIDMCKPFIQKTNNEAII